MGTHDEFRYPPFHAFPPSYSRQPIESTLAKQTQLWCDLIRDYCKHHRVFWLDIAEAAQSPLFHNSAIDRRLGDEDIKYFLSQIVARGDGEWDAEKKRCLVYWRRPAEWGDMIYQWVDNTGQNNTVMTVYEIRQGDSVADQEFYGLNLDMTMRALEALQSAGKCVLLSGEISDSVGVKFL